jgi:CRP-like cAMP-binding protein
VTSYSAGMVPQRDLRPLCAHQSARTADSGRDDGIAPYSVIPDPIFDLLSTELQHAAVSIARYLVQMDRDRGLDERVTDRIVAKDTGLSMRSIQRALNGLEGLAIIRRRRSHGRRVITITGTLLRARQIEDSQP